ncbi:MAG: caspase family protein [Candidatus Hydrogenedentes bacterium]|nr:caspase family protein [Candidatus Hydrogenedentota bacterium]
MARYALVAGIDQYEHGELSPLQFAEADARRMANRNNNIGFRVVCVPSP